MTTMFDFCLADERPSSIPGGERQCHSIIVSNLIYPVRDLCGPSTMHLPELSNKRRWSIVNLLFAASLINYLDRATISFALPLITTEFHLTSQSKGLLLSAFFWSYALMQIPIGLSADRFNLRWLYAGAFTVWSFAQGLTGLAGSLTTLLVFRILL